MREGETVDFGGKGAMVATDDTKSTLEQYFAGSRCILHLKIAGQ
jgi:hypothetical protein